MIFMDLKISCNTKIKQNDYKKKAKNLEGY